MESAALFVVGCSLVLFLAPGVELFGIRYVAVGQGNAYFNKKVGSFSGDVYIDAVEVPVIISYEWGVTSAIVEYKQEFIVFTRTERKDERVEFEIKNNNLHIKTYDLEEFIYSHKDIGGESAYLKVKLP